MLLRAENLTKDYGRFRALQEFTLEIGRGEIFGLLGPNGSGKSTAIRLFLGFMKPTAGAAWIAGHHCWRQSVAARKHVSYLPGELRLYENMSGRRLLRFLGELRGGYRADQADHLAQVFDIDLSRPLSQLSSGMKRKVALLVVLSAETPLLILDEPTNTLDPTMRGELLKQLRTARQRGQSVLFSSHVLSEVEQVCDRVGILQRGRLVHQQPMNELRQMRKIHLQLAGDWDLAELNGIHQVNRDGDRVTFYVDGELESVLRWLAERRVTDLKIESVGLESVYAKYHGNGQ